MDMFRVAFAAGLALLAAACGGSDGDGRYASSKDMPVDAVAGMPAPMAPPPPPPPPPPAMEMARADGAGTVSQVAITSPERQIIQQDQQGGGGQQPAQLIAYTYNYGFKVPPGKMEGLLNAHKKACQDAG